jgi:hypothetical protein
MHLLGATPLPAGSLQHGRAIAFTQLRLSKWRDIDAFAWVAADGQT